MSLEIHETIVMVSVFAICILQTKKGNAVTAALAHMAIPAILVAGAVYGGA